MRKPVEMIQSGDVYRRDKACADSNRALLRHVYEELSKGNSEPLITSLADDISWTIIGTTALSGTFKGKQEVFERLFARLRARLAGPVVFAIDSLIAEADQVVLRARGEATSKTGKPYNNTYCIIARFADGKITEMTDFVDTALIDNALG
jgi:ketosteroid isomerase-like protein